MSRQHFTVDLAVLVMLLLVGNMIGIFIGDWIAAGFR